MSCTSVPREQTTLSPAQSVQAAGLSGHIARNVHYTNVHYTQYLCSRGKLAAKSAWKLFIGQNANFARSVDECSLTRLKYYLRAVKDYQFV
eukprot:2742041-Prymnesium_polylepis.1